MSKARRVLKVTAIVLAILLVVSVIGGVSLYAYSVEQNKTIRVSPYTVTHNAIPAAFDGMRLVHLSDLHNKDFGEDLTACVRAQNPDIIVITGDWISRETEDIAPAVRTAEALVTIAPVYYVAGNHEAWAPRWAELCKALLTCGVNILENSAVHLHRGDDTIQLIGMFDTEFSTHIWRDVAPFHDDSLFSVFLLHRPEYAPEAASFGFDLMLSGHTHGGQIRLPLIGAVYAPNQGFFPQYDVGQFEVDGMTLIVSQGLGESASVRILTPPEVVVITLDSPHV